MLRSFLSNPETRSRALMMIVRLTPVAAALAYAIVRPLGQISTI